MRCPETPTLLHHEQHVKHALRAVQDHLLEVLRPGLAERAFSDGEYLIRQGDQGTHLLYILEGTADVLLKLSNPRIAEHRRWGFMQDEIFRIRPRIQSKGT